MNNMAKAKKKSAPKARSAKTSNSQSQKPKAAQENSPSQKRSQQKRLLIGVVTSRFNQEITQKLEDGALEYLQTEADHGLELEVLSVRVPGAVEIPLVTQTLLENGCDGVVALGAVIRGETTHYDYVCNSVETGLSRLMLDFKKPVGFGVLTTENEAQAMARAGGEHGNKGTESAQVVIEMVLLQKELLRSMKVNK